MNGRGGLRWLMSAAPAVLRRPGLWATAARQMFRLARRRWWLRPPFLPVPDRDYLRFRLVTMYGGDGDAAMEPEDLVEWLEWCKNWRAVA